MQAKLLEEELDLERLYLKVVKLLSEYINQENFVPQKPQTSFSGTKGAKKPGKHPKLANDLVF